MKISSFAGGVQAQSRAFQGLGGAGVFGAPLYPNTIVIDRDSKEFHEREGLLAIITIAGLPMFEEVPYRRATAS